ncbi:effector-associated domain EAD1-containing protein [Corallococcus sp. AS-1-12]|uniref:VMAP-C domain-containing protein n=1 Tax=Corallococcus sp. AS-1-12 TaxID=2874598 RepID=UPI001CBCC9FC|nr:effector-associated domain EAD1-containing protein [Corallococcus sp. AS-1-12]MBZ4330518.1 hypothetical protein [Corallococcus sp. AS-1-12]
MDLVLDGAQLKAFADALCSAFPSWEALKQFTRYRLGIRLNRFTSERDLDTSVSELLEHAEAKGWLVLLLRQALRASSANTVLQQLEKELLPRFPTARLQQLETLVEQAPLSLEAKRLEQLAQNSMPQGWMIAPAPSMEQRPATTFMRLVDSLSSAPAQSDGAHPLLKFIDQVAGQGTEPTAGQLRKWLQEEEETAIAPSAAEKIHALRLFVKCESKKSDTGLPEDEAFVTAWLWSLGQDQRPLSLIPECVLARRQSTLGQLPEVLAQVLREPKVSYSLSLACDRMTIEVCLRHKLLPQNVDAWPFTSGEEDDAVRLGFRYPVVVRPYERLYESQWRGWGLWRSKWEQLKQLQVTPELAFVEWLVPSRLGDNLAERLQRNSTLCVAIPVGCEPKLLQRSVNAGAPAVLSLRKDVTEADARLYLQKLLEGPLLGLPDRVHTARQQRKEPLVLEEHITLLWDNPDRLPPDAEDESVLAAPAVG